MLLSRFNLARTGDPMTTHAFEQLLGTPLPSDGEAVEIKNVDYLMHDGILRQKSTLGDKDVDLSELYEFHWKMPGTYDTPESEAFQKHVFSAMFPGYEAKVGEWLKEGSNVLDAGCGTGVAGRAFFDTVFDKINYVGVDLSAAVDEAKKIYGEKGMDVSLLQSDLYSLPFDEGVFDVVFCPGVLHYTDDVKTAMGSLSRHLVEDGVFVSWFYQKQPPIREFTDMLVRRSLADLPPQQAFEAMMPLTKLGHALGELNQTIELDEDIPVLGIPAGTHDVQRLFYYYVLKVFHSPDLGISRANLHNFNAFYPQEVIFTDPDDVPAMCEENGLKIEEMHTQGNGISLIARKIG